MATALDARARIVAAADNERLVAALEATASDWSDPSFAPRVRVTASLSESARLDPDMVAHGLHLSFAALHRTGLEMLLAEAERADALERPVARACGSAARLCGPRIVFHSLAGNVPGLAIPVIVASLLARGVAIGRHSARQAGLTEAFLETLAAHDADAAAMIVPVRWTAGDPAWEREVFGLAARVELYGSEATLGAFRRRHPGPTADVVERGPRMSVGLVPSCALLETAAEGFAIDVVMYDGLGCLTPHAILVPGPSRAARFAELLAAALARLEAQWPRRRRPFQVETVRRSFIDACEVRCATRGGERLLRGSGDTWIVHESGIEEPELGPGLRCVRVLRAAGDDEAVAAVERARMPLAAVGVAMPSGEGLDRLASRLRRAGATLVCEPGRMQAPPLTWTQDGRRRLGDLLSWQTEAA